MSQQTSNLSHGESTGHSSFLPISEKVMKFSFLYVKVESVPKELQSGLIEIAQSNSRLVLSPSKNSLNLLFSFDISAVTPKRGYFTVSSSGYVSNPADACPSLSKKNPPPEDFTQANIGSSFEPGHHEILFGGTRANSVTVVYNDIAAAFRALGRLLGCIENLNYTDSNATFGCSEDSDSCKDDDAASGCHPTLNLRENCSMEILGAMFDLSRNAVMKLSTLKFIIQKIALMGFNTLLLYMEDSYKIPQESFFGYLRGAYSFEELKFIDDYAHLFHIQVIPCIQTLGHLGQVLQWPAYASLKDTKEVLLANHTNSLVLIEKMLKFSTAPFRSKYVHIGCDEVQDLGSGNLKHFFAKKGSSKMHSQFNPKFGPRNYQDSSANYFNEHKLAQQGIYYSHLLNVVKICRKLQLKPLLWSDMILEYLRTNPQTPQEVNVMNPLPGGSEVPLSLESLNLQIFSMPSLEKHSRASSLCSMDVDGFTSMKIEDCDHQVDLEGTSQHPAEDPNDVLLPDVEVFTDVKIPTSSCQPWPLVPSSAELVYWNYYNTNSTPYSESIALHSKINYFDEDLLPSGSLVSSEEISTQHPCSLMDPKIPWVATGAWTWNRFWTAIPFSMVSIEACLRSCEKNSIKNVFVTMWGDDGTECDMLSSLPCLQCCADLVYCKDASSEGKQLARNFSGSCGASLFDWIVASSLDQPFSPIPLTVSEAFGSIPKDTFGHAPPNFSKWLLWQDPLLGHLDPILGPNLKQIQNHYSALAKHLFEAARRDTLDQRLIFPARIADTLSKKICLRQKMVDCYSCGDLGQLKNLADHDLPELQTSIDKLWRCHRKLWLSTYKPFGLEVIENRYGCLRIRLESLQLRIYDMITAKEISDSLSSASFSARTNDSDEEKIPEQGIEVHELFKIGQSTTKNSPTSPADSDEKEFCENFAFSIDSEDHDVAYIEEFEEPRYNFYETSGYNMPIFCYSRAFSTSRCMGSEPSWI